MPGSNFRTVGRVSSAVVVLSPLKYKEKYIFKNYYVSTGTGYVTTVLESYRTISR
jgi:hypothetical protein